MPKPKPVCFMVMPFGNKPVQPPVAGAPATIDFDALWYKALTPVIERLGYAPVRADQDIGAGIISEMLERLYFSDVVVADMTIPNGNVYYEIGIRHASRPRGCVLIGADWSRPLFDVDQMRRIPYPLPEGTVTDATADAIQASLRRGVQELAEGSSPMVQSIPGYPDEHKIDPDRATSIRAHLDELAAFQAQVRSIRLCLDDKRRSQRALALRDEHPARAVISRAVALELVGLLRDCGEWQAAIDYIDALPQSLRELDITQELRCLALSKAGDHELAIGALEELIRRSGDTSERQGLIGGRYKKLMTGARKEADASRAAGDAGRAAGLEGLSQRYLDHAIAAYERGMKLDLNDYFPTCNLPRLYRERGRTGDEEKAELAASLTVLACERARKHNPDDPWILLTLLGACFDAGDVDGAAQRADEVRSANLPQWMIDTTVADLEISARQAQETETAERLRELAAQAKSA